MSTAVWNQPASATNVCTELVSMLDRLAGVIVEALGFGVAAINLTRADGRLEVVSVAGDPEARRALLGSEDSVENWDALLAHAESWGGLLYVDHDRAATGNDLLTWVPDIGPVEGQDAWYPGDELFAPLTATDGTRLGIVSVGLPVAGRRPGPQTRQALEAFAFSASLAIEHATNRMLAEASEHRFRQLATRDVLTGAGNRSMLLDRLHRAVSAPPDPHSCSALLFIDLDGFKAVNDQHSHAAGDHLLCGVADRIHALLRTQDTLVRWGGDEFLVLLEGLEGPEQVETMVGMVAEAVAVPVTLGAEVFSVTASIGVALQHPGDGIEAEELIRRADADMYRVKRPGRGPRDIATVVLDDVPVITGTCRYPAVLGPSTI